VFFASEGIPELFGGGLLIILLGSVTF